MAKLMLRATVALLMVLAGCGGDTLRAPAPHMLDPAELSLSSLERLPLPEGVSPALWAELRTALAAVIREHGTAGGTRTASDFVAPAYTVTDLATTLADGAPVVTWSYVGPGDYDLNGAVTINDLAPIGRYFNARATDANWAEARVADGNGDGLVSIADLTPLGAWFGTVIEGYALYRSSFPSPEPPGLFDLVERIELAAGTRSAAQLAFSFADSGGRSGDTYIVRPYRSSPNPEGFVPGAISNAAVVFTAPGPWPMYGHDPQHTFRTDVVGPARANLRWLWSPDGDSNSAQQLRVIDGVLYAIAAGDVYRQVLPSGVPVRLPLPENAGAWVEDYEVFADGCILVLSSTGELCGFEPDGSLRFRDSDPVRSDIALGPDGNIYFVEADTGAHVLRKIAPDGSISTCFTLPDATRRAPQFFSNGDLLVRRNAGFLQRFSPDGTLLHTSQNWDFAPSEAVIDSQDRVYRTIFDMVELLSPQLEVLATSVDLTHSTDMLLGELTLAEGAGRVYTRPRVDSPLFALDLELNLQWSKQLSPAGFAPALPHPAVVDGLLVCPLDGAVAALRPDGSAAWTVNLLDDVAGLAGSAGATVVSGLDGFIYGFDSAGQQLWRQPQLVQGPEIYLTSIVTTGDGGAYLTQPWEVLRLWPTGEIGPVRPYPQQHLPRVDGLQLQADGSLFGFSRIPLNGYTWYVTFIEQSGMVRAAQEYNTASLDPQPTLQAGRTATGAVLVPAGDTLYALTPDGAVAWTYVAGAKIYSSPTVAPDGTVLLMTAGNRLLHALTSTGNFLWSTPFESANVPFFSIAGDVLYAVVHPPEPPFTQLLALRLSDRQELWRANLEALVPGLALGANGHIYVCSADPEGESYLLAFEPDGAEAWRYPLPDRAFPEPVVDGAGTVFVTTTGAGEDGHLTAVKGDGSLAWEAHLPSRPTSLALGADGSLYVGGAWALQIFTP
jgi:outer membrane protein assembly factor BamB